MTDSILRASVRVGPILLAMVERRHPGFPACLAIDYAMRVADDRGPGAIAFLGYDEEHATTRFDRAVEIAAKENAL